MDELVELLWNDGAIVVQGQNSCSNYNFKTSSDTPFMPTPLHHDTLTPSVTSRETNEKKTMINKDAGALAKFLPFNSTEPMLSPDIFSSPTRQHDHDDTDADTVPWIDYTILDKADDEGELPSNLNPSPLLPHPSPSKAFGIKAQDPVHKSGQDDSMCANKKPPHLHFQRDGLGAGLMNFSHFLRPVALAKATLQSAERLKSNEKASTSYNNNSPLDSMVIQSAPALQSSVRLSLQPVQKMPLPCGCQNEVHSSNHTCNRNNNNNNKNNNKLPLPPSSLQPIQKNQLPETEKEREKEREKEKEKVEQPAVASSSICSINVNPKHKLKKKKCVEKELCTHSDEVVQDESMELTRPSTSKSTGTKRGRTAEVHNLSERKRRDRINEKMRALQELIPNCNKVDKASMLDEAIEYLKSLQLQVQMMMMMGTGMYTPPMMLPPGLPHMPFGPYPQMGMGMGMGMGMCMGMGYGMGAGDINHHTVLHTIPTLPLSPHLNFMPMINGGIFPLDATGIPPAPRPPPVGPQDDKRHANPPHLAQSGVVGVNRTDTNNGVTVKSATSCSQ